MAIELTRIDEFAVLTLNRPDALNALSFALIEELGPRLRRGRTERCARAAHHRAPGRRAFCAGADIKELTGPLARRRRSAAPRLGQAIFAKLDRLPMPSVAIINGYAFGGGLELALACTFRLATRNAKMGSARDQARADPRLRRHAAAAARGRRRRARWR